MPPRRLCTLLGAALILGVAACPAGAIVGGSAVAITAAPYQVALVQNRSASAGSTPTNLRDQFCGGSIRDSTHVITAAHCVYDSLTTGQAAAPSQLSILAGTATLSTTSTAGRIRVRALSFDPSYDAIDQSDDAAILTLADPLPDGAAGVGLVGSADWSALQQLSPAPSFFVTGWGSTIAYDQGNYGGPGEPTDPPADHPASLRGVSVPFVPDAPCGADYQAVGAPVAASTVCAGVESTGGKDSCQGDSGGPLVSGSSPSDYVLVGIVSSGYGCAQPNYPGLYTEIDKPSVRSFVSTADPAAAPANLTAPSVAGTAEVGSTVECLQGTWTESPTLRVQFVRSTAGGDVALTSLGGPTTYPVQRADVGASLACIVEASSRGGTATARSAPSATVPQPPATVQPAASAPVAPTTPQDVNRPVTRVLSSKCLKTTCTLRLSVADAGFTAGIAKVVGSVRSTYRRAGRTRHRTRTFTARRTAATRFTVRLTRLPVGTQLFTLLATDRANHRQLLPTRRTLRTTR